jgi:hypothetical protein
MAGSLSNSANLKALPTSRFFSRRFRFGRFRTFLAVLLSRLGIGAGLSCAESRMIGLPRNSNTNAIRSPNSPHGALDGRVRVVPFGLLNQLFRSQSNDSTFPSHSRTRTVRSFELARVVNSRRALNVEQRSDFGTSESRAI